MKNLIFALVLAVASSVVFADDDSDIISGCALSNAEFGTEMIQICINENKTARAAVHAYPEQHKALVGRCTRRKEMGWSMVKRCIDDDIAAKPALEAYAKSHAQLLVQCQEEFQGRELSRIKLCVETALMANSGQEKK